jgi:2,3-dihydroxyphenylpropionate 1,2-dioxygenase
MGKDLAGIGMSHAPGILGWPDAPPEEVRDRINGALIELTSSLDSAKPDVIVAFLDDHFDNHYRNLMPTFAVGVADKHSGPGEHYLEMLRIDRKRDVASNADLAEQLLSELVVEGFDVARMGEVEYGNNLMVPLQLIRPQLDIPVVPIFINVFTPPLPSVDRAYLLGEATARALGGRDERIVYLATGGLSHWPPIWMPRSPGDDQFLRRMKRFQTDGRSVLEKDPDLFTDLGKYEIEMAASSPVPLVNAAWDREFLDALARGDVEWVRNLSYEEVEKAAGHGGHEILNWAALMGAMRGAKADVLNYEPVTEWICGMGFASYAR